MKFYFHEHAETEFETIQTFFVFLVSFGVSRLQIAVAHLHIGLPKRTSKKEKQVSGNVLPKL
jgi:hypothetical protein